MSTIDIFLWGVAPYLSLTTLIVATAIRRVYFARTWTAKSSEFLEKKQERIATPLFHLAILMVFAGHVGGLLVPEEVTESLGVSETMYHAVALGMGGLAGIMLAVAVVLLIKRRFADTKRMRVNTSTMDKIMYVLLAFTIIAGLTATLTNADGNFNYRESLSPWIRGVLILQPDPSLMVHAPIPFKVHMCGWMVLFAVLPFTRLVHLFSGITAPFRYIGRAAIVYRRRKQKETNRSLEFPSGVYKDER